MKNGKKILVTDKVHPSLVEGLEHQGFVVDYVPKMDYSRVIESLSDYNGLIINSKVICDKAFLDKGQHLEFIGRLGSGLDIIDLDYARALGIRIISSPEGNANAVGEHVLGMLLTLLHNINRAHFAVRHQKWNREENRGIELKNMTVGILGFGHTGPAFAQKLTGMGVRILVYDKYRTFDPGDFPYIRTEPLDFILEQADILSIHLPLTGETIDLVDAHFISKMKKGAILINSSRGRIVRSDAVKDAIESGQLSGACLDVLENERLDKWSEEEQHTYSYFLTSDRVILTPHIAGWTIQSLELIATVLLSKIRNFYNL